MIYRIIQSLMQTIAVTIAFKNQQFAALKLFLRAQCIYFRLLHFQIDTLNYE